MTDCQACKDKGGKPCSLCGLLPDHAGCNAQRAALARWCVEAAAELTCCGTAQLGLVSQLTDVPADIPSAARELLEERERYRRGLEKSCAKVLLFNFVKSCRESGEGQHCAACAALAGEAE